MAVGDILLWQNALYNWPNALSHIVKICLGKCKNSTFYSQ